MTTEQRILQAAREAYARFGYRGATTRRIARAAGVNEVTIFRRFRSKKALLAAALDQVEADNDDASLDSAPAAGAEAEAALARWVAAQLALLGASRITLRAVPAVGDAVGDVDEPEPVRQRSNRVHARLIAEAGSFLRRVAEERGSAATDTRAAAAMLVAVLAADAAMREQAPELFPDGDAPVAYARAALGALALPSVPARRSSAPPPPFDPDATGA